MTNLYLKSKEGMVPIDDETAVKYHLEQGEKSPFTQSMIVGKHGEQKKQPESGRDSEASIHQDFDNMPVKGIASDGIDQMENGFELSQSEIIDFSQGVDSRSDENK